MSTKETKAEIDQILEKRYNNFQGRVFSSLKVVHDMVRINKTDEQYLAFLKRLEEDLPRPVFAIDPASIK